MQFWSSLKKFTRAYLFQIAREKSCDYLLIICMKTFEMVKQEKRTRITQSGKNCVIKLRHPRRALNSKAVSTIACHPRPQSGGRTANATPEIGILWYNSPYYSYQRLRPINEALWVVLHATNALASSACSFRTKRGLPAGSTVITVIKIFYSSGHPHRYLCLLIFLCFYVSVEIYF